MNLMKKWIKTIYKNDVRCPEIKTAEKMKESVF